MNTDAHNKMLLNFAKDGDLAGVERVFALANTEHRTELLLETATHHANLNVIEFALPHSSTLACNRSLRKAVSLGRVNSTQLLAPFCTPKTITQQLQRALTDKNNWKVAQVLQHHQSKDVPISAQKIAQALRNMSCLSSTHGPIMLDIIVAAFKVVDIGRGHNNVQHDGTVC